MRVLIPICCWLFASGVFAQSAAVDSLVHTAQRFYNTRQPDSLYQRLAPDFRRQVPLSDWRTFLIDTYRQYGPWQQHDYLRQQNGFAEYTGTFERGTLLVKLAADATGQLTGFGIVPLSLSKPLATDNPLRTRFDRQLDSLVRIHARQQLTVGLSIGIVRHDSLFVYNYGETSRDTGKLPTDSTLYEIGSVSKTFTATILADYVGWGWLKLSDPVNRYLPDSIPPLQRDGVLVTVQMLANHTSGLPRLPGNLTGPGFVATNPYLAYDTNALFSFLKSVQISSIPGTVYQYSNLGAGLLGTILERIAGKSYDHLLRYTITEPLAMNQTALTLRPADRRRLATGYTEAGQPTTNWDFRALVGAGGIRSTVHDLLRYLCAELGWSKVDKRRIPEALSMVMQTTQTVTFQNASTEVGLGWHRSKSKAGWWHNGGTGGYASFASFDRPSQTALVILSNTAIPVDPLAASILRLLVQ